MKKTYALLACILSTAVAFGQGETCATAAVISGTGIYSADGPATGGGAAAGCGVTGTNSDWYVYTPTFTGTVVVTSCLQVNGTIKDTYLAVYSGTCGSLNCIGFNDDTQCTGVIFPSYMQVSVVAGTTYYIEWKDIFNHGAFQWQLIECDGTVQGVTYLDQNSNSIMDSTENMVTTMLQVDPGGYNPYSSGTPFYSFCSDSGTYTISVPNPPLYHTVVPPTRTYTITIPGTVIPGMDFAFQPIPGIYDGRADLWGWNPWIGNNTSYHINYHNVGTENLDGAVVLTMDTATDFVSAIPVPTSVNGQVVTWNVAGLLPGADNYVHVVFHTHETTQAGQTVTAAVDFNTAQIDVTPLNDHDVLVGHASTSFDPNEKSVDQAVITTDDVANGKALEYTVHFQNTGNAPAVNIVVRDTLDNALDLSTFEMIGATHPCSTTINGQVLTCTFASIMLPYQSMDENGSNGGFSYRVRVKDPALPGTMITNTAGIYFDFNAPVITNTVLTGISAPENTLELAKAKGMVVYPSPSDGNMNMLWALGLVRQANIDVLDATGRVLLTRTSVRLNSGASIPLDLSHLSNGNYMVRVSSEQVNLVTTVAVSR